MVGETGLKGRKYAHNDSHQFNVVRRCRRRARSCSRSEPPDRCPSLTFTIGFGMEQRFREPQARGYSIVLAGTSDNGAKFKMTVTNAFSSAASSEVTLTVIPDTAPPRLF